jgi:hypothetical protein
MRFTSANPARNANGATADCAPVRACQKEPYTGGKDRIQRQTVPLLGLVFRRQDPIELTDQRAHIVCGIRHQFYRDLIDAVHKDLRTLLQVDSPSTAA